MNDGNQDRHSHQSTIDLLKEWKDWIPFVALILTPILSGLLGRHFGQRTVEFGSWILGIPLFVIAGYVARKIRNRKLERERARKLSSEHGTKRTAFRSLAPFEENDQLPGSDRVKEARIFATRISSDDFRFGIICGASGCGKTSLLRSEVMTRLRASGLQVSYVRSRRRLENVATGKSAPESRILAELGALSKTYIKSNTDVLILDQFEEWFIEYPQPELRKDIGRFIREFTSRHHFIRIVCAIRHEFLINFHDFRDVLNEPLLANSLFYVRNFNIDQAVNVIRECALADGLAPDDSVAQIIAQDLSEGGEVRPAELQIVCTNLASSGRLSTSSYRQKGGTAGILARHIQEAIAYSRYPNLAARMLRVLSNFPARAKRTPKTVNELVLELTDANVATNSSTDHIKELIEYFVADRILVEEQRKDDSAFALMHDYLVDAVQMATSEVSTKNEEANQLLRYYLAELKGVIPLRRLFFLKKFADRQLIIEPASRRLIRRSIVVPVIRWLGTGMAAIALASALYLFSTAHVQWSSNMIGRHWPNGESGFLRPQLVAKDKVATGAKNEGEYYCLWDLKNGKLYKKFDKPPQSAVAISPSGRYLLFDKDVGKVTLIDLVTNTETVLEKGTVFSLYDAEDWVTGLDYDYLKPEDTIIHLYSIREPRMRYELRDVLDMTKWPSHFVIGDRMVVLTNEASQGVAHLYEIPSTRRIATLKDEKGSDIFSFAISPASFQVCTLSRKQSGEITVSIWSLKDGSFLFFFTIGADDIRRAFLERSLKPEVKFSSDGPHIVITGYDPSHGIPPTGTIYDGPGWAFDTSENERSDLPGNDWHIASYRGRLVIFWKEGNGTKIWDATEAEPKLIPNLTVNDDDTLLISPNGDRAVVRRGQAVELWNISTGNLISNLPPSGLLTAVNFTANGTAIALLSETHLSLYDSIDGKLVIKEFTDSASVVFYSKDCRRLIVWNSAGQVIRYTEGRKFFGKFIPSRSCKEE